MIKEIDFKSTAAHEPMYAPVSINKRMEAPVVLGIDLLHYSSYVNTQLSTGTIEVLNEIPDADWIPVSDWNILACVSKKFREIFEPLLKGYWYPIKNSDYSIFLLDNIVDALDLTKTKIVNSTDCIYWYTSIENETFVDSAESEYIFTIPQDPDRRLASEQFENLYSAHGFKGVQFYKDINFQRSDPEIGDMLRLKSYDDEGFQQ